MKVQISLRTVSSAVVEFKNDLNVVIRKQEKKKKKKKKK